MHPFAIGVLVALVVAVQNPGQDAGETPHRNSTRKIRPPLGEQAARVGCAVPWRKDVAAALAEAKASGRLVFWYVPTVARSPMDRKPEIDRYLRHDRPYDCAGSYKAESAGPAIFDHQRGDDPTAVIGLPLIAVCRMLRELGVDPLGCA